MSTELDSLTEPLPCPKRRDPMHRAFCMHLAALGTLNPDHDPACSVDHWRDGQRGRRKWRWAS
jgi:hypothetical protein